MIVSKENAVRIEIEQALDKFALAQGNPIEISGGEQFFVKESTASIEEYGEHSLLPVRLQSRQEVDMQARVVDVDRAALGPFTPSCVYQLAGGYQSCSYVAAVAQRISQGRDIGLEDLRDRTKTSYQCIGGLGGIVQIAEKRDEEILQDR